MKKLVILVGAITCILNPIYASLADSLVACYSFSGNAKDGSGNGHDGTVTSATLTADRFTNVNSAYNFGNGKYIDIIPADSFLNSNYTYSAWVKPASIPAFGGSTYVLSIGSTAGDQAISLQNNSNWVGWSAAGYTGTGGVPGATQSVTGILPSINTWYHLVSVRNNSTLKLYVNGHLAATTNPPALPYYGSDPTKKAVIGERFPLGGANFNGVIDDVRIYKKALDSAEISQIYMSADLMKSIVACYPFTGNANDGSGNGHTGTVTSSTLTADRFANANSAYSFNGSTTYIDIIPADSFLNNNYTYSAWVKPATVPSFGGSNYVISVGSTGGDQAISLQNNSNWIGWSAAGYNVSSSSATQSVTGALPTLSTWYHLVSVRNDSTLKLFVNGQLVANNPALGVPYYGTAVTKKAIIGERFPLGGVNFDGIIDDVRMYKRALTDAEISALYYSPAGCSLSSGELTCSNYVSVEESVLEDGFKLFPNPSKGLFDLEFGNNESNMNVFIVNSMGQIVYENKVPKFGNKSEKINLSGCAKGMYFVVIQTKDKEIAKKIIIE